MPKYIEESPEVYYAGAAVARVGDEEVAFLKERAAANPRLRCRLCLHDGPSAAQHEMLIVHHRDCYVRPHRHEQKSESLIVVDGEAVAFVFGDDGRIERSFRLGPAGSGAAFSYFMPAGVWHGLAIVSTWFTFLEAAAGPFVRAETTFPVWAPDGSDAIRASKYVEQLGVPA
jgi:cupin fold WbuC family metalloprotein